MSRLTFIIGATAVGKSYFIEKNYDGRDVDIFNVYDYQQRVYAEEGYEDHVPLAVMFSCLKKANDMLLNDIIESLSAGRDVVVEHTLFKAKRRITYIEAVKKAAAEVFVEFYVLSPSDGQWADNLKARGLKGDLQGYKNNAAEIEFPNPAEGIDKIYEVVDGEIRERTDAPNPDIIGAAHEELAAEAEELARKEERKQKRAELLESMKHRPFWHYCEVCGKKELLTAAEAFKAGWDYPPDMGCFGLLGPRTCGGCSIKETLFWKVNTSGGIPVVVKSALTPEELEVWERIRGEPQSLLDTADNV